MNIRRWLAGAIIAAVAGVAFAGAVSNATSTEHGSTRPVAATAIEYGP
ncbi:hypothetical protein [Embleya sp. NPDC005575]